MVSVQGGALYGHYEGFGGEGLGAYGGNEIGGSHKEEEYIDYHVRKIFYLPQKKN